MHEIAKFTETVHRILHGFSQCVLLSHSWKPIVAFFI